MANGSTTKLGLYRFFCGDHGGLSLKALAAARLRKPGSARRRTNSTEYSARRWGPTHCRISGSTQHPGSNPLSCLALVQNSNADVYNVMGRDVVKAAVADGVNGCVFAYGQTSSGKTFTMLGQGRHLGVIPLAVKDAFALTAKHVDRQFMIKVSYLEIYNEVIRDLLADAPAKPKDKLNKANGLQLREAKGTGVYVEGLREVPISNVRDGLSLIVAGEERRKVAATNWNEHSSRSHTIFRMSIESRAVHGGSALLASTLNLVDLAGSECIAHLGKNETRRSECRQINSSLHALGRVILKLSQQEFSKGHVPFRDSKLTRLLQPSLGGNCRTAVVCTITPAYLHAEETLNTIRFALRAQHVRQHAKVNEVNGDSRLLRQYESQIKELKQHLEDAKASRTKEKGSQQVHSREMEQLVEAPHPTT